MTAIDCFMDIECANHRQWWWCRLCSFLQGPMAMGQTCWRRSACLPCLAQLGKGGGWIEASHSLARTPGASCRDLRCRQLLRLASIPGQMPCWSRWEKLAAAKSLKSGCGSRASVIDGAKPPWASGPRPAPCTPPGTSGAVPPLPANAVTMLFAQSRLTLCRWEAQSILFC